MSAFIVLIVAALSRLVPVVSHPHGWNFTALGGGLLFFGSRMKGTRWQIAAKLGAGLALLAAMDFYLTVYAYGYAWHTSEYLVTWLWYVAACLLGMGLLEKAGVLRCAAATLASATSFFLLSNLAVWMGGMYPHTLSGLGTALAMGLPFYRNDLASTALTVGVLFGVPVLAARIEQAMQASHGNRIA
ncbi:MAG TPA: DUF6580 family putative transport protein [Acidobacteriaceae bacterium]|nr:DUF6580 family putative transport protein [Acidobacteriaceae bacterium]